MPGMTGLEAVGVRVPEDESKFVHPVREASDQEKRSLYGTALEIAVRFVFTHNSYTFGGKIFLQHDSGPIGMRVTMAVARVVMGQWGDKMREILNKANITTYFEGLFIDDIRYVLSVLPPKLRFDEQLGEF